MTPLEIVLLGAPMGKERLRFTRDGHGYTPERTLTYEARLARQAQDAIGTRPVLSGPLKVEVVALMPLAESKPARWKAAALAGAERPVKKPDWDNFGKILDAMNLIVWADDAQIVDGRVQKFYWHKPGLIVRVAPAAETEQPPAWALRHVSEMATDDGGLFE